VSWKRPDCSVLLQWGFTAALRTALYLEQKGKSYSYFLPLSFPSAAGSHGCDEEVCPGCSEVYGCREQENKCPGCPKRSVREGFLGLADVGWPPCVPLPGSLCSLRPPVFFLGKKISVVFTQWEDPSGYSDSKFLFFFKLFPKTDTNHAVSVT